MPLPPMLKSPVFWLYCLFVVFCLAYAVFSFSLTDPNLVISTWAPYWNFQTWIWQTVFSNNAFLTHIYIVLIVALSGLYLAIISFLSKKNESVRKIHLIAYAVVIAILFFSYNALSHDVFNYMFNAKILVFYHGNPQTSTALEYPNDLWLRFMHNVQTPAPYGLAWTALSVAPYVLGMNKFVSTWLLFRALEVLAVWLLYQSLQLLSHVMYKKELALKDAAILFLNPLFLIEIVSNMHNDLWMMVPAVYFVALFLKQTNLSWKIIVACLGLFFVSVSVKFATVLVLIPVAIVWVEERVIQRFINYKMGTIPFSEKLSTWVRRFSRAIAMQYIPLACSMLMFIPLFTARSQQFHPWYLVWSLCWIPVIKQRWWKAVLIIFSFSSLLRYIPWLYQGGFLENTVHIQQTVTWSGAAVGIFVWWCISSLYIKKNKLNPV